MSVATEDTERPPFGAGLEVPAVTLLQGAAGSGLTEGPWRGSGGPYCPFGEVLTVPLLLSFPSSLPPSLLPLLSFLHAALIWLLLRHKSSMPLCNLVAFTPTSVIGTLTAAMAGPDWSPVGPLVPSNPSCVF